MPPGASTPINLGLMLARLRTPPGLSLPASEAVLRRVSPAAEIAADNLHFQNGGTALPLIAAGPFVQSASIATPVGIINGAPAQQVAALRGFAKGAPVASHHGSAVTSLLSGAGARNLRVSMEPIPRAAMHWRSSVGSTG